MLIFTSENRCEIRSSISNVGEPLADSGGEEKVETDGKNESEKWSSQWIFQFMQLEIGSLKKIQASTGFEPVTSALPVRCSTNWAMKPHIGSKVNCRFPFSRERSETM